MKEREHSQVSSGAERRRFLQVALLGAAGLTLSVPLGKFLFDITQNGEGNEDFSLAGELLEGGEIVDNATLAQLYKEVIDSGRPVEADPTIIRSTVYNGMLFFGTSESLAAKRSQNITLSKENRGLGGCRGGAACVYDSSLGLGVELTPQSIFNENSELGWLALLQTLSHEAFHLSVKRVNDRPRVEDFGVLGKYRIFKDTRGFWRAEEYRGELGDLMKRTIPYENGERYPVSFVEEFFAELGKSRYFKYLMSLGLGDLEIAQALKDATAFPFFRQGLIDVQDTQGAGENLSWQDWWGGVLNFADIDKLHYKNDRVGLFESLGARIVYWNKNPDSHNLSRENLAGLGLVAFNDFIDYDLTNHEVIFSLVEDPIREEVIAANAELLRSKIPESYLMT
ncbi:MAG: hypothetical protein AAB875_07440 [Patescibacteria group bacterium]